MAERPQTTVLIILDGWGVGKESAASNPITPKNAPFYFELLKNSPYAELGASGVSVGLPKDQEGNSEAGHLNIGAGRVVKQDAMYISESIADGTFYKNTAFVHTFNEVKKKRAAVHLVGLLSNHNSAHSCPEHLYTLLEVCRREKVAKVYLHLFTDGRDSGQHDALKHLKKLQNHLQENEEIATIMGRLYGMDRNKNWERTKVAYEALTEGVGRQVAFPEEAISVAYNSGETDEFIMPTIIAEKGKPVATVQEHDAIIFFNLRSDRTRQLTKAFVQPSFEAMNPGSFKRTKRYKHIRFVAMTDFGPDLPGIITAYPSRDVYHSLVQTLCPRKQLYVSESEKFAHITYFFNGGYAQHFCDEQWVMIASDTMSDFSLDPTMKADEVANYVVKALAKKEFDFIAVNLANADMVGHTGSMPAGAKAVSAIDNALKKMVTALYKCGGQGIITADHGNIEEMLDLTTGETDTEHSRNPVPCVILGSREQYRHWGIKPGQKLPSGKLADVAPTVLAMMQIPKPREMTGKSLI